MHRLLIHPAALAGSLVFSLFAAVLAAIGTFLLGAGGAVMMLGADEAAAAGICTAPHATWR